MLFDSRVEVVNKHIMLYEFTRCQMVCDVVESLNLEMTLYFVTSSLYKTYMLTHTHTNTHTHKHTQYNASITATFGTVTV